MCQLGHDPGTLTDSHIACQSLSGEADSCRRPVLLLLCCYTAAVADIAVGAAAAVGGGDGGHRFDPNMLS